MALLELHTTFQSFHREERVHRLQIHELDIVLPELCGEKKVNWYLSCLLTASPVSNCSLEKKMLAFFSLSEDGTDEAYLDELWMMNVSCFPTLIEKHISFFGIFCSTLNLSLVRYPSHPRGQGREGTDWLIPCSSCMVRNVYVILNHWLPTKRKRKKNSIIWSKVAYCFWRKLVF